MGEKNKMFIIGKALRKYIELREINVNAAPLGNNHKPVSQPRPVPSEISQICSQEKPFI